MVKMLATPAACSDQYLMHEVINDTEPIQEWMSSLVRIES